MTENLNVPENRPQTESGATSSAGRSAVSTEERAIAASGSLSDEALCAEIMSPEQLAESRAYQLIGLRCELLERGFDLLFATLTVFLFAKPLVDWLADAFPALSGSGVLPTFGMTAALTSCLTLLHSLVSLPLSFFDDWVVEKRFGLSNLTPFHWFRRYLLQELLAFVLNLFLLTAFLLLIRWSGVWWVAFASIACFLLSAVLGSLVPVLIMPLFYRVEKLNDDSLTARFQELTRSADFKLTGIYRLGLSVETSKANAMLAGLGATRRALLGDTLLENFSQDEIVAVFAHELGHHAHRHILKLMIGMLFVCVGIFGISDLALRLWLNGSIACAPDYATLPVWTIPFFMLVMTVVGIFLEPVQNAVSRRFEWQADNYALQHCGAPEAMRSAFVKLAVQNKADPFPSRWEVFWLHSHPAIGERIRNAQRWINEQGN